MHATYYCGTSYNHAVEDCSIPCPSGFGYNAVNEENECPEDMPYCFGPNLPCTPAENTTDAENTTEALNVGFLSLGDFGSSIGDNATNATVAPSIANNETLPPSIAMTSSPSINRNETNTTFPPSVAPFPAGYNESDSSLAPSVASAVSIESNSTMALSFEVNGTTNATRSIVPTPAPTEDELEFRKGLDNPSNMFCGT